MTLLYVYVRAVCQKKMLDSVIAWAWILSVWWRLWRHARNLGESDIGHSSKTFFSMEVTIFWMLNCILFSTHYSINLPSYREWCRCVSWKEVGKVTFLFYLFIQCMSDRITVVIYLFLLNITVAWIFSFYYQTFILVLSFAIMIEQSNFQ